MLKTTLKAIIKAPIQLYRLVISPFIPSRCRYHPTCSAYGLEAIEKHGAAKGLVLALRRFFRCNPWRHADYLDPVPETIEWRDLIGYKRCDVSDNQEKQDHESTSK